MTAAEPLYEATVALDDILTPPQIHQILYDGLVPSGHSRGFAFCVLGYARDPSRTFVLLRGKKDALPKGAQSMAPVTQGDTFDFNLKANAEHSHGGKRMPYARHDNEGRKLWLHRVADRAGFELLDLIELETRTQHIEDHKRQVRFPVTTWAGTVRVKDPEAFTQFLLSGCGKGRAWGFGTIKLFDVADNRRDAAARLIDKMANAHQRGGDVAGWLPLLAQTQTAIEAVEDVMEESPPERAPELSAALGG